MRKFSWVFLLLPFVELYLLLKMGEQLGAIAVVMLVVLSIFVGVGLIRNAGVATALLVRNRMQQGERPDAEMLTGFLWVAAGVLLIIPGPITDFAGLLCLLPITRKWLAARMLRGFATRSGFSADDGVIEGEFSRSNDDSRLR